MGLYVLLDRIPKTCKLLNVLIDFSLTVKAATLITLIFISGRGSAISSAKERISGFIYNLVKSCCANVRAFHENPKRIHTELKFINP